MITATLKNLRTEDISLMLNFENHKWNYLCDCGYASQLSVKDCRDTNALFISHTHIDHFINFDHILRHQLGIGRKIVICGPAGLAKNVQNKIQGFTWNLLIEGHPDNASYEIREIHDNHQIEVYQLKAPKWELEKVDGYQNQVIYQTDAFQVRYTKLNHGIDTIAYLFEEPAKIKMNLKNCSYPGGKWVKTLKAAYEQNDADLSIDVHGTPVLAKDLFQCIEKVAGYKLGYIMDHLGSPENHQRITTLFEGADEVYMEAYYADADQELAFKNNHSTARLSGQVARLAKIKKIVPAHFSRRYHDDLAHEALLKECFDAFEGK
ncbi:MAG: peptidase [Aureispira sp.]|nr:peptidase [Aureispira sp.]